MIGQDISHFKVLEQLGEGGMGVVYKAQDLALDRFVALKFLPEELTADPDAKRRFIREAKAASALDHPNICTVYEVDELPDGRIFIAMGYYEGESLEERLAAGSMKPEDALAIIGQVARGLAAAHKKGIVHRDVKPANILITKDGQVKILDFGVAKLAGATRLTMAGSALGTLAYMSPEQVEGKDLDSRSDIFSLGVILYEALTGSRPFQGAMEAGLVYSILNEDPEPLSAHNPELPALLQQLVDRMLAKEREDRLASLDDFVLPSGAAPKVEVEVKASATGTQQARAMKPGDRIGPYRLRERIGVGGMGEVWAADQEQPIKRRVALKIIKLGMDSKEVVARFEAERQALALMNHPNVAKVYEAGMTPEGRPYFAMEYVSGVPITEYCDRHTMGVRDRLGLFQKVCEGVQHAHQKAIIHRDLKPANVLVGEEGGKPTPKIIDFGVAKATSQRLTEQTMYTQLGVMIGTPEYMSPEQADLTGEEIDTRTDVYSLGVILYELLVGALPFEPSELRQAGFEGIRKMIREQDPPRPSTRISSLGDQGSDSARTRCVTVDRLSHQLQGDLDWITMKALEKDRQRRYPTPVDLARDIDRHLNDIPVEARPPTLGYRVNRYAKRHRVAVTAGALILLALVGGGTMATVGFLRARAAQAETAKEAEKARKISEYLYSILEYSNPMASGSAEMTVQDVIEVSLPRIDEELSGEDDIKGTLRNRLGTALFGFGDFPTSIALLKQSMADFERHYGGTNEQTEWSRYQLCWVSQKNLEYDETISLATQGVDNARVLFGGPSELEVRFLDVRGDTYRYMGDLTTAERDLRQAMAMLETVILDSALQTRHDIRLNILNNLALVLRQSGQLAEAESMFRQAYEKNMADKGEMHNMTLLFMSNVARTMIMEKKYEEATDWLRRCVELKSRQHGLDHPFTRDDRKLLEKVEAELAVKK